MNAEEIGKKLRSLRGEKAQGIVANALGISRSALSMYESGQRIPRDEIKIRFARYYDKSVEYIFLTIKYTKCKLDIPYGYIEKRKCLTFSFL